VSELQGASSRPNSAEGGRRRWLGAAAVLVTAALATACGGGGGAADDGALPPVDRNTVAQADPGSPLPADWQRGPFMQIYVRGYQDSNGDGVGDLRGLVSRLDYLRGLGVRGLWLMPITRSQDGDHGYAVVDYRNIEPAYGTLADFDELVREAHARDIGVILDHVINHSAAQHPAFVNSAAASTNELRDWYVWQASCPGGWNIYGANPWHLSSRGCYFGGFWSQMPDFNLRHEPVVGWHEDHLRFWLNRGADGFRFDAVGNLVENGPTAWENQPENYAIMGRLRGVVAGYSQRSIVCEAPADPVGYAAPTACGRAFGFGLHAHMVRAARGDGAALQEIAEHLRTADHERMATFLANHDAFAGQRLHDQLGGQPVRLRLAATLLLLMPGTPFLYYGEEIGMAGAAATGLNADQRLRTPMSWTGDSSHAGFTTSRPFRALAANAATINVAAQLGDPDSLLAHYRGLITLRHAQAPLRSGSVEGVRATSTTLGWQRRQGDGWLLVAVNVGTGTANVSADGLPAGARFAPVWPATAGDAPLAADTAGRLEISVPPQSAMVLARLP
jgi:glycosidase